MVEQLPAKARKPRAHPKVQHSEIKTGPSIESRFLMGFTRHLILAMKSKRKFQRISHPVMDIQVPAISQSNPQKNVTIMLQSQPVQQKTVSEMPRVILTPPKVPLIPAKPVNPINPAKPINWARQGLPAPLPQITTVQQTPTYIQQLSLDKIKNILLDTAVFSVECPGPSRPLVTVSRGLAKVTSITLTDEEINAFMKDIAQKTRIPLTPGLFKAVFGNLLIIAVVSEFVGTRFIIQKRA